MTTPDVDLGVVDEGVAPPLGSTRSRVFWTFADQALSSLTNAALALVVAKSVSKNEFGAFSLALVSFAFIVGLSRSMIGDPFVVRFTDASATIRRRATAQAAGAALVFGFAAGLVCLVAALLLAGQARMALLALALSLPGLVLQETWRHTFFSAGRPRAATINDAIWTVVQFALIAGLLLGGQDTIFRITLAWGFAATLAAAIGVLQTGIRPAPLSTLAWFYETRDLNVRMGLDFALNMGAVNLAIFLVTGLVGLVGAGALRAAQVLLGPLNLLFAGASAFALPMLAKRAGNGRIVVPALATSLANGLVASAWVGILLLIPRSVGVQILGDSWDGARSVMVGSGIVSLAVAFVIGPSLGLKALRRADQMLRVTFIQAPIMLTLGALGAWQWGAPGAAFGFAIAQVFGLVVCWSIFIQTDRAPRSWLGPERTGSALGRRRRH